MFWVASQLVVYQMCVMKVLYVGTLRLNEYQQQESGADLHILAIDLASAHDQTESLFFLNIYINLENTYLVLRAMEVWFFMHPECDNPVLMGFTPFRYPLYNDFRLLWTNAAEQMLNLRNEIEFVRYQQNGRVAYGKDLNRLLDTYKSVVNKFYSLKHTVDQLSALEINFQYIMHTFPYNVMSRIVPRWETHFLQLIAKVLTICDNELQIHPVYIMVDGNLYTEENEPVEPQEVYYLQQQQQNISIALHAQ